MNELKSDVRSGTIPQPYLQQECNQNNAGMDAGMNSLQSSPVDDKSEVLNSMNTRKTYDFAVPLQPLTMVCINDFADCNDIKVEVTDQNCANEANSNEYLPESQAEIEEKQEPAISVSIKKEVKRFHYIYSCEQCHKNFSSHKRLTEHLAKDHCIVDKGASISRCTCELCGRVYCSEEALAHHRLQHKSTKEYNHHCSYCNRSFAKKHTLICHEQTHTQNYRYRCRFCGKGSASKQTILFHETKKHNFVSDETSFYPCSICGKTFPTSTKLAIHKSTHREDLPIKCGQCDKRFKNVQYMNYHVSLRHLNKPQQSAKKGPKKRKKAESHIDVKNQKVCPDGKTGVLENGGHSQCVSQELFITEEIHIKDELSETDDTVNDLDGQDTDKVEVNDQNKCEQCDKMFKTDKQMKNHLRSCHLSKSKIGRKKVSVKMKSGDINISEKSEVEPMEQQSSPGVQTNVGVPMESFITEEVHIKDELSEIDETDYDLENQDTSKDTENKTTTQSKLPNVGGPAGSERVRKTQNKHRCVDCDKTFFRRPRLIRHRAKEHGIEDNDDLQPKPAEKIKERVKHFCKDCNREFWEPQRLNKHRAKMHGIVDEDAPISRWACEVCGKVYFSEGALAYHRSKHQNEDEGEFNHNCSYCDRSFTTAHHRRLHEQSHTKNYKFKCRFCDKGSPLKKTILWHEAQVHNFVSDEICFHACSICGKNFPNPSRLAIHESTHREDFPVKCEQCDKRFKNIPYMKQHLNMDHLDKSRKREKKGSRNRETTDLAQAEVSGNSMSKPES